MLLLRCGTSGDGKEPFGVGGGQQEMEGKLELNARSNVVRRVAGYDSSLTCKCTDHSGPH